MVLHLLPDGDGVSLDSGSGVGRPTNRLSLGVPDRRSVSLCVGVKTKDRLVYPILTRIVMRDVYVWLFLKFKCRKRPTLSPHNDFGPNK